MGTTRNASPDAVFERDIHDPLAKRAELLVMRYFSSHMFCQVEDARAQHLGWDMVVTPHVGIFPPRRTDVKLDKHVDRSGNVVFENAHFWNPPHGQGLMRKGWGWNEDLDWLAVVGADSGTMWLLSMHGFRALMKREYFPLGYGRRNEKWTTQGTLVPLDALRSHDVVILETPLDGWKEGTE